MNDSRFAFSYRPFSAVPHVDHYVSVGNGEQICRQCVEAVHRDSGPAVIFGGAGMGKTMTCLRIAQSFAGKVDVIFLSASQIASRADLLKTLLYELHMPYRGLFDGELRLSLLERLQHGIQQAQRKVVLIVDEAQALSPRILEELRLLTNVIVGGVSCMSLVLCGSSRLEELLNNPQLESLSQRISARHFLRNLSLDECHEYIRHKVELAGVPLDSVFDSSALQALHLVSNGIPRLIDQLADRSIAIGNREHDGPVSEIHVEHAWQMHQQALPPWTDDHPQAHITMFASTASSATQEQIAAPVKEHSYAVSLPETESIEAYDVASQTIEQDSWVAPETSAESLQNSLTRIPPSAGKGLSSAFVRESQQTFEDQAIAAEANEQIEEDVLTKETEIDDEFEAALAEYDLQSRASMMLRGDSIDNEALFGHDFNDEAVVLSDTERTDCPNCDGAGFCLNCDQMSIATDAHTADALVFSTYTEQVIPEELYDEAAEDLVDSDDALPTLEGRLAETIDEEEELVLGSFDDATADPTGSAPSKAFVNYFGDSIEDLSPAATFTEEHLDANNVIDTELNTVSAGYGHSFDLQPVSSQGCDQPIEEELLDMVSNMNMESISIDPQFNFEPNNATRDSHSTEMYRNGSSPAAFGSFVDLTQPGESFFSSLLDADASPSSGSYAEESQVDSIADDSIMLHERLRDLEGISAAQRAADESISLSNLDAVQADMPRDDREILIVDEDLEELAGQHPRHYKPVASAMLQTYSKLFTDLR